jgi:hypothetical protein
MLHRKNRKFTRTLTPPLGDEELAQSLPDWLLGGERVVASWTDGRTPLGYRSDAARLSVGTSHDRWQDAARLHESANDSPPE